MAGASLTPEQQKRNAFQQLLPRIFSVGKIDWEMQETKIVQLKNQYLGCNVLELGDSNFKQSCFPKSAEGQQIEGNDQLKTNTVLQMRDVGIEYKTI